MPARPPLTPPRSTSPHACEVHALAPDAAASTCAAAAPIDPARCPLCGSANACAQNASPGAPCWCQAQRFPDALLARVPETARGLACICAQCAAQAGAVAETIANAGADESGDAGAPTDSPPAAAAGANPTARSPTRD